MNFSISFLILNNEKYNSSYFLLVIINKLIKMIYNKLVKKTIYITILIEIIMNVLIKLYDFSNSIKNNKSLLFVSKIYWSLYHFLDLKQLLFIAF